MEFADYERRLAGMQETLQFVQQAYLGTSHRAVIVLEGWDTAGKGGVVRRLGWALDPRSFKVHATAAPDRAGKAPALPATLLGTAAAAWPDRRVRPLLVRPRPGGARRGLCQHAEWHRAYDEINHFERMLLADGTRLVKLFLHITPEEQLRRFRARLTDPLKRWKLSYEDFRNRGRWHEYQDAIEDMVEKTSTRRAPWHLIPANNKPFGRLAALRVIADRLSKGVSLEPRPLDPAVADAAAELLGIRLPPAIMPRPERR